MLFIFLFKKNSHYLIHVVHVMEIVDIYFEGLYLSRTIFVCHDSLSSNKLFHTIKNANGNKNHNVVYDNLIG